LAVLEDSGVEQTHSIYFKYLKERGFSVDFVGSEDRSIKFKKYGEWQYDHLILFAPSASDVNGISSDDVLEFIDAGRNVIIAADSNIGDLAREIASECNVEYDEEGTSVIDHLNFDASDKASRTLVASSNFADAPAVFKGVNAPVLFRGVAQDIEEDSELLFPLLTGSSSACSSNPSKAVKDLFVSGKKISLVTALQARNNARVIFSGSLELFSDKFFTSSVTDGQSKKFDKSGNEDFAKQITSWAFQEKRSLKS